MRADLYTKLSSAVQTARGSGLTAGTLVLAFDGGKPGLKKIFVSPWKDDAIDPPAEAAAALGGSRRRRR